MKSDHTRGIHEAVAEVLSGRPVRAVAREFKLPRSSLVRAVERIRTSTPNGEPPIPLGAILGPCIHDGNGTGGSLAPDSLTPRSEDSFPPVPPPATSLPSPLEIILRRLDDLESAVRARAALEEIPADLFDDLEGEVQNE